MYHPHKWVGDYHLYMSVLVRALGKPELPVEVLLGPEVMLASAHCVSQWRLQSDMCDNL